MLTSQLAIVLADIEGFMGIVFFLVAFVGWVINLVNQNQGKGNNQRGPRRPRPAGERKRDVQGEIDEFLTQSRRRKSTTTTTGSDDIEVVSTPKQRRRPPRRRKSRQEIWEEQTGKANQPAPPTPKPEKPKSRPGQTIASRHLESKTKKKDKPKKQLSHINERVEQDLPHSVDASVSSHLQTFSAAAKTSTGQIGILSTTRNAQTKAGIVGKLLKSKDGIRNAIILNEILSPPRSMR